MDKKLKQTWVKALRSGKYQQGKETLRTASNEFCCLGVLCDLVYPNEWVKKYDHSANYLLDHNDHEYDVDLGYSSSPLLMDLGLTHKQQSHLIKMNDGEILELDENDNTIWQTEPQDFNQIADWIEANV